MISSRGVYRVCGDGGYDRAGDFCGESGEFGTSLG